MAVASDGQLFAWGDNSHHQLGLDPNNLQWGGRHADDDEEYKFENLDDQEKEDS
jgi:alpha-tubulin suppressor-like RCC1 family protein